MKKFGKFIVIGIIAAVCALSFAACDLFGGGGDGKTPKSVTVTLNPNGGTVGKLTIIGEEGSAMELPAPSRTGYKFDAWYDGWSVISNTVFPSNDVTLTARYYADSDTERTITTKPTETNKVYGGHEGSIYWDKTWFEANDWQCVDCLRKNITTSINVTIKMEYTAWNSLIKSSGSIKLTGANASDIIASQHTVETAVYSELILTGTTTARDLVGSNDRVLWFYYEMNQYNAADVFNCRNITITIEYTEKAGTLV